MLRIFLNWCAIILMFGYSTSDYSYSEELYDGSPCKTELGEAGNCKKIPECPPRLAEALAGKRRGNAPGRCGFDGNIEIVCCPLRVGGKIDVRPADLACQEYEMETKSFTTVASIETSTIAATVNASTYNPLGAKVNPYIFHGTRSMPGEFPYMAALGYVNTDEEVSEPIVYNCGGSLISPKYVLTAAHCVSNVNERVPKWVKLGSVDIKAEEAQEIPIHNIIEHPDYRRSRNYNDIALVGFRIAVLFSAQVKPLCLQTRALKEANINTKITFVAIGFGATSFSQLRSTKLMKSANLKLVPPTICNESYSNDAKLPFGVDDTLVCATDANITRRSDACHGDSGGPLIMITDGAHSLVGITAFGQSCGSVIPGVYTAVQPFLGWIESKVWSDEQNDS